MPTPPEPPPNTIQPVAHRELPDEQVEHPDEGRDAPLTMDAIKEAIHERVNGAAERLVHLRQQRDALNASVKAKRLGLERDIKAAVAELAEAKRIANALKPRTRTKKPAAK